MAELAGNRARARAVVRAWRWNLGRLAVIRARRPALQAKRRVGDKEIRLLQVRGSARLSAYLRRVFQFGFHGAHADELAAAADGRRHRRCRSTRSPRSSPGSRPTEAGRVSGRVRLVVWLAAALLVVIGSRGVLTGRLPGGRPVHAVPGLVVDVLPVLRRLAPVGCRNHRAGGARPWASPGCWGPSCSAPWA